MTNNDFICAVLEDTASKLGKLAGSSTQGAVAWKNATTALYDQGRQVSTTAFNDQCRYEREMRRAEKYLASL